MAADLREFYDNQLAPELAACESARIRSVRKCAAGVTVGIVAALILLAAGAGFFAVAAGVVIIIFAFVLFRGQLKDANAAYKQIVITRLLETLEGEFHYRRSEGIPKAEFMLSQLFSTEPNIYRTEDLVSGRVGATTLKFAEIDARRESGSGKNRSEQTVFRGVFFVADFHKDFQGGTWVVPDVAERTFGTWLGTMLQKANWGRPGELVKLEDPEFERLFAVYATDQVESRYILTPSMMERMVELHRQFPGNLYFAFLHSCVAIAISYKGNLFEPPGGGWSSYLDFDAVCIHYRWLTALTGIVETMNLNTRIWSKH